MNSHPPTSGHRPALIIAWLHFEVSVIVWLLIGALSVAIAQDFELSATQTGLLVAVPLLSGALLRIVVGTWTDRFGAKRTGLGTLGIMVVALLYGWLSGKNYHAMLGVGMLLGAAGASFAVALPIASQAYPPHRQGWAMGIVATGNSGVILATLLAPRIAEHIGWHGVFGVMIPSVVMTALVFDIVIRDRTLRRSTAAVDKTDGGGDGGLTHAFRIVARERLMQWLCVFYAVTFGGFVGLASFLPIFFHDHYGVDVVTAGTMTALCALAGSLARPLGGYAADRSDGLRLLQMSLVCVGALCAMMVWLPAAAWAMAVIMATMFLLGFGNGIVFQVASLRYLDCMGAASGFIGAAGGLGGFVLPFCFGFFKDATGTYASGFLMTALCAIAAAISIGRARQSLSTSKTR